METKKRIEWLSEGLDGFTLPLVKEIITVAHAEQLCEKKDSLSKLLPSIKAKYESIDWDRINAEKFNNKEQLKMEDWEVRFESNFLVFRNGEYICVSSVGKLNSIIKDDNSVNEILLNSEDSSLILKLFRPELERVTNEFNNR